MKRALVSLMASVLLMTTLILPTAAADWTDPDTLLPVDIVLNQEALEIRKVYDLSPTTDPSTSPERHLTGITAGTNALTSSERSLLVRRRRR